MMFANGKPSRPRPASGCIAFASSSPDEQAIDIVVAVATPHTRRLSPSRSFPLRPFPAAINVLLF